MLNIARRDSPWIWGFHPQDFLLYHKLVFNAKANTMANNTLKYLRIDPVIRESKRIAWNQPNYLPIILFVGILFITTLPAIIVVARNRKA